MSENKPLRKRQICEVEATPLEVRRQVLRSFLGVGTSTRDMEAEVYGFRKNGFTPWAVYRYYGFTGEDSGSYSGRDDELASLIDEFLSNTGFDGMQSIRVAIQEQQEEGYDELLQHLQRLAASGRTERVSRNLGRVGQDALRELLLRTYRGCCALCETRIASQLRTSHIVPWGQNSRLRLKPDNAILLCRLHDGLFDSGLISLTDDYQVLVSTRLDMSANAALVPAVRGVQFSLPTSFPPDPAYLKRHRMRPGFQA